MFFYRRFRFYRNFLYFLSPPPKVVIPVFSTMDFNPLTQYLALEYKALCDRMEQQMAEQNKLAEQNKYLRARIDEMIAVEHEMEIRLDTFEATLVQLLNYYPLGTKKDTMDAMQSVMNNPNFIREDLEALLLNVETDDDTDLFFDLFNGDIEI